MKLLSIKSCDPFIITGYVERDDDYAEFLLAKGKEPAFSNPASKNLFRTYSHYVQNLTREPPHAYFLSNPIELDRLDFDQLTVIYEEIPEFRMFRREATLVPENN